MLHRRTHGTANDLLGQRGQQLHQGSARPRAAAAGDLRARRDLKLQALPLGPPLLHAQGRRGRDALRAVQGKRPASALPSRERHEGHRLRAHQRVPARRGLSALCLRAIAGGRGRPARRLRAAQGAAGARGAFRSRAQKAAAEIPENHRHHHLARRCGGA